MATVGSQILIQRAVNSRPELLRSALRRSGALSPGERIEWRSPLMADGHREYRDDAALQRVGLVAPLREPLKAFWPARGPVWDGLAVVNGDAPLLVEAKAHIPETVSQGSKAAAPESIRLIGESLGQARRYFAPRSRVTWDGAFYQYANRLAYQFFLRKLNGINSRLVFLYFTNAGDMDGPTSEEEWHGAVRLIHAALGLPARLHDFGVYEAFIDARLLADVNPGAAGIDARD